MLEAEGRVLRRSAFNLGWSLALAGCAAVVMTVGLGCLLSGIYLILSRLLGVAEALIIIGTLAVGIALLTVWRIGWNHRGR
ncbi:MAG: hypothetical protein MUF20_08705 [Methylotetracoccus sp.]|nr:hypothetical protein [Methylotetracoccus sp.]